MQSIFKKTYLQLFYIERNCSISHRLVLESSWYTAVRSKKDLWIKDPVSDIITLRDMLNCSGVFCLPPTPYFLCTKQTCTGNWVLLLFILLVKYYCCLGLYIFPDHWIILWRIKLKKNHFLLNLRDFLHSMAEITFVCLLINCQ